MKTCKIRNLNKHELRLMMCQIKTDYVASIAAETFHYVPEDFSNYIGIKEYEEYIDATDNYDCCSINHEFTSYIINNCFDIELVNDILEQWELDDLKNEGPFYTQNMNAMIDGDGAVVEINSVFDFIYYCGLLDDAIFTSINPKATEKTLNNLVDLFELTFNNLVDGDFSIPVEFAENSGLLR